MTVARTTSAAVIGVTGHLVQIEACVTPGPPGLHLIGVPDNTIAQTRDRVRAAVINSGCRWPDRPVTVSLYPASLPKRGSGFDLPIAIAVLAATGEVPSHAIADVLLTGELGLDGTIRQVRGAVPAVLAAAHAGLGAAIVPVENRAECLIAEGITVGTASSLHELVTRLQHARSGAVLDPAGRLRRVDGGPSSLGEDPAAGPGDARGDALPLDLADVSGNDAARHALEVCAAGGHHLALKGPPGGGATMLAERLPTILPPLDPDAMREIAAVRSCAGLPVRNRLPLISPHHTTTPAAMSGRGSPSGILHLGLISLAHRGVLFLDQASEFSAQALHTVRTALETGEVPVPHGGGGFVTLPARIQLVISERTCWCPDGDACGCAPLARQSAGLRIRGLLDRIEVHATVTAIAGDPTPITRKAESSAVVADRVREARERATARLAGTPWRTNAEVPVLHLRKLAVPADATAPLLEAETQSRLHGAAAAQVMRVAWTLADLRAADQPTRQDVTHAIALRNGEA